MTINVNMDLYRPEELRAFAIFANAIAEAREKAPPESDQLLGGISRLASEWKNAEADPSTAGALEAYAKSQGAGPIPEQPVTETKPIEGEIVEPAQDDRPHGKAGGGRARRTKGELAEDTALEKLAISAGIPMEKVNTVIKSFGRTRAIAGLNDEIAKAGEKPAISTGEERVDPEDDAETEEQDMDDEVAENAGKELTADDVKGAMAAYLAKHGMEATQEDGSTIFAAALGPPPEGNVGWKVTLVAAAGQDAMKKAIKAWTDAAASATRYKKPA